MQHHCLSRRTLMTGVATLAGSTALPVRLRAATDAGARFANGPLTIDYDSAMRSRISIDGLALTGFEPGEALLLVDGTVIDRFALADHREEPVFGPHGRGRRHLLRATADRVEQRMAITLFDRYPGLALIELAYRNTGPNPLAIAGWHAAMHDLLVHPNGAWSFAGASYPDRRDWIQPVVAGFQQANYMGMNGSDYGGGTPVAVAWRPDAGIAVGHVDTVPRLISLPVSSQPGGTRLGLSSDRPTTLAPGATLTLPSAMIMVHRGDHFGPLDTYRRMMAERGLAAPKVPQASYAPIWCAWGYERNFTTAQILATLPKAKSLGLEWVVLDDGWQTSEGDWAVDRAKFPRGDADLKVFADAIKAQGMKPRLWFSPLAADPGTALLHDYPEMLLLDRDGAAQNVSWWDSYTLCPAYPPVVEHFKAQIRRIIGDWGFEGLKLDGQHLNGVAPCYNPAHHHARPEESFEKLQDFWKALYDTAVAINPQAVVEICPCGDSFAFHNIPAMNNTPASDPESSWQVRLKGKTFKALMGPSAPFTGDHVELSDRHDDFASTYGIGAIPSTKFTWPRDNDHPLDQRPPGGYVLTPQKEAMWAKWIALYRTNMLPQGQYRGELYDIGFDKPEGHAVEVGKRMHFAFYADQWDGPVALRGLSVGRYQLTDSFTGHSLGTATAANNSIRATFQHFLLVEASPIRES